MLQQVKTEDEDEDEEMVAAPGVDSLFSPGGTLAARSGVPPYTFLDVAGPSTSPPTAALPLPRSVFGAHAGTTTTTTLAAASPAATRAEAAARMKASALPTPLAETLPTLTLRCLLGLKMAAVDRRPGLRRTGA